MEAADEMTRRPIVPSALQPWTGVRVRRVVVERLDEAPWGPEGQTEPAELLGKSRTPYDVAEELLGSILAATPRNRA